MITKLENINTFILSKILLKIIALSLSCFIIFNCVFSSLSANIDSEELSKFSTVQRDVFSAVFFISNTIEKINFAIVSKTITDTNSKQTGSENENNKTLPCTSNDFIVTCLQIQSDLSKTQNTQLSSLIGHNVLIYTYECLFNSFYNLYKNIVSIFIILLFFSSIKKLYDSYLNFNINRENPAFMHI
ncbi:MAG: hypothetical protein K5622_02865 [Endomicrobiaceae bacterium]|nr:hypothetical protein [Endomicrobiaceae bacterium]